MSTKVREVTNTLHGPVSGCRSKDVPIALAAMKSQVECLISSDKDLTESEELKRHVPVLLPAVFLREYMGWTSEELEVIRNRTWSDIA
jgi:predicted nucleic acid-binding protein